MTRQSSKIGGLLLVLALATVLTACASTVQPAPAQPAAAPAATQPPALTQAPALTEAPAPTEAPAAPQAPVPTQAAAAAAVGAAGVSYARDVQPIFDRSCVKCHGGSDGVKGGLSLKTIDDLMKGGEDGLVIVPGDAGNSMLVQAIEKGKMPKRAARLPQAQIDAISAWVAAGAQNN